MAHLDHPPDEAHSVPKPINVAVPLFGSVNAPEDILIG
jgi:hypothetical protein